MITKISANGSSDIIMLLASLPAAAWANAGVISIRVVLGKTGMGRLHTRALPGPGKFARTIAAAVPIATLAGSSFAWLAGPLQAR